MRILGISSYYHDSAAALVNDGEIISAVQEERFSRIKHDANFPKKSIEFCLKDSKININDIDYFCFYEKPFLKFERLLETYLAFSPYGFKSFKIAIPIWVKEKLFQKNLLKKELIKMGADKGIEKKIIFSQHHLSHAASAYYPSPFKSAAVSTLDGVGEWATTTLGIGKENDLEIIKEIKFPHSLGLLYSAFTYYTGFKVNSGEYKLMGLAPYGKPKYVNKILDNIVNVKNDGSFRLNQKYFDYCTGLKMINNNFETLFGLPSRKPSEKITNFYMDIASSIQQVLEYIVLKICRNIRKETKQKYLCMAGGVALNCVINGKIIKEGIFEDIWVQPAAGDAGGALGAALIAFHKNDKTKRFKKKQKDTMKGSLLGPSYNNSDIRSELSKVGARVQYMRKDALLKETVKALRNQKIIGWFQGKMEFGPRALGNRSILADPRSEKMQKNLNLKIKYRESFRPFAPSIIEEKIGEWFSIKTLSPYMLFVYDVNKTKLIKNIKKNDKLIGIQKLYRKRSVIPAVTHVDNSARIQTVGKNTNPLYYELIKKFYKDTKCPILINTSFNIRSEPIVCSPSEAFRCLMGTDMDLLVIGNYLVYKTEQDNNLIKDYRENFNLD